MFGIKEELDLANGEAYDRILISHPIGSSEATVYSPPVGESKAWVRKFPTIEEAESYAIGLASDNGQRIIPYTRDKLKWWLPERFW